MTDLHDFISIIITYATRMGHKDNTHIYCETFSFIIHNKNSSIYNLI